MPLAMLSLERLCCNAAKHVMEGNMAGQLPNTLKGKIKSVVSAPPYEIVTIAIDPKSAPEITVAHIPVPGGPSFATSSTATAMGAAAGGAPVGDGGNGNGNGGNGGDVTVTIPVPNAVIVSGN